MSMAINVLSWKADGACCYMHGRKIQVEASSLANIDISKILESISENKLIFKPMLPEIVIKCVSILCQNLIWIVWKSYDL